MTREMSLACTRRAAHALSCWTLLLALLLPLTRAHGQAARREPRPPSGIGGLVVGWAGLGWGVLNLGTLPLCFADFYPREARPICTATSLTLGAGGLIAAAIGLSVGYPRRTVYKRWRARQSTRITLVPVSQGALVHLTLPFRDF